MTVSAPVRDLLQLALGSFPRSQEEKDRSRALLRCAYRGRTRKVRLSIVENCGGPGSGRPGPCPDPSNFAKDSANRMASLFGLPSPKVQIHDLPGERTFGESSGSTVHLVNIDKGLPINKQINFPLGRPVTEGEHLAAHEVAHWAYSVSPESGKAAADKLANVKAQYGSAVSLYGSFGGKFENLMELAAVYSHSSDSLKKYSPEMFEIARDWVESVKLLKIREVHNDSRSQPVNRTDSLLLLRTGRSSSSRTRSGVEGLQHLRLSEEVFSLGEKVEKSRHLWRLLGNARPIKTDIRLKELAPYLKTLIGDINQRESYAIARAVKKGIERRWKDSTVARQITKTTSIEPDRAKVIARTEMARARTDVGLGKKRDSDKVVFTLGAVDRTCPRCRALEGKVYTVRKAAGVIPVHPSCRCVWTDAPKSARVSNANPKGCNQYSGKDCSNDRVSMADMAVRDKWVRSTAIRIGNPSLGKSPEQLTDAQYNSLPIVYHGGDATSEHIFVTDSAKLAASHGDVKEFRLSPGATLYADPESQEELEAMPKHLRRGHVSLRLPGGGSAIVKRSELWPKNRNDSQVSNVFCATGEGGGVDPSCGSFWGKGTRSAVEEAHDSAIKRLGAMSKDREHAIVIDSKTGKILREDHGEPSADWTKGEVHSVPRPHHKIDSEAIVQHVHTHMDALSSFSDGDWANFANKNVEKMSVIDRSYVYTLTKDQDYINAAKSKYTPRDLKEAWNEELARIESSTSPNDKPLDDYVGDLIHETNVNLAKRFGFTYTRRKK